MRATITNNAKSNQGVWTDEGLVHIEPGRTLTVTIADGHAERTQRLPFLTVVEVDALDHDADGEKGGSEVRKPPALSGKSKPALIDIAKVEGVTLEDDMTAADIRAAIELNREA